MKVYTLRYECFNPNPNLGHNIINLLDGKIYTNPREFLDNAYAYINDNMKTTNTSFWYDKPDCNTLKNMKVNSKLSLVSGGIRIQWHIYIVCLDIDIENE